MVPLDRSYNYTRIACYLASISQAIITNLGPLLFTRFHQEFNIGVASLALLICINFVIQLLVDWAAVYFVDRIGYRASAVIAGIFCTLGLYSMGVLPYILHDAYIGLVITAVITAIGSGLFEVITSPIIAALPVHNKSASMSLLHSFYSLGFIAVVLFSTLYFSVIGIEHWRWLPLLWSLPPTASFLFFIHAPILPLVEDRNRLIPPKALFSKKILLLLLLMMACAGAAEQAMCQWASFFAETGLKVSKTMGDLLGPCTFALLMALGRIYFGTRKKEQPLERLLFGSSVLCLISYLITVFSPFPLLSLAGCALCGLAVSVMWPGTLVLASRLIPLGGAAMFAVLALAGDAGCSIGPGIVGFVMEKITLEKGLLAAAIFPIGMALGIFFERMNHRRRV
jgi:fucose permease